MTLRMWSAVSSIGVTWSVHEVATVFGYLFAACASQAERHVDAGLEENDQDGQPTAQGN